MSRIICPWFCKKYAMRDSRTVKLKNPRGAGGESSLVFLPELRQLPKSCLAKETRLCSLPGNFSTDTKNGLTTSLRVLGSYPVQKASYLCLSPARQGLGTIRILGLRVWWAHLSTTEHRPQQRAATTISHLSLTTILAGSHSVLIHGPTRRGGIPKSAQTQRPGILLFHTFQITAQVLTTPQEFPEPYYYEAGLRKGTEKKYPNFPQSLCTNSPFLPILRPPSFFLAMVSTSKKKKRSLHIPVISGDPIQCANPLYLGPSTHTHTRTHAAENHTETFPWPFSSWTIQNHCHRPVLRLQPTELFPIVDRDLN